MRVGMDLELAWAAGFFEGEGYVATCYSDAAHRRWDSREKVPA